MKRIEVILRPTKVDALKTRLAEAGVRGMTVTPVSGFGQQLGQDDPRGTTGASRSFRPKVKCDLIVDDRDVRELVEIILAVARTGAVGDGKIFISSVPESLRIRTGESGFSAL